MKIKWQMKCNYIAHDNQSKSIKNMATMLAVQLPLERKMDETNWYLGFDSLLNKKKSSSCGRASTFRKFHAKL